MDHASLFTVVVNDEEQYSLWPHDKELPSGWQAVGAPQSKASCLDQIEKTWLDMRPKSVREWMASSV